MQANFVHGDPDLAQIWENLMHNYGMDFEVCIPAVVVSYDRVKNVVTCRPALNRIDTAGQSVQRTLHIVPCFNPAGSGIGLNFPLQKGDTGWIFAGDRDPENYLSSLEIADPSSDNIHRYAFGFFVPDKIKGFAISPEDAGALVIETLDAATRISVKNNRVKITRKNVSVETNGFQINLSTPSSMVTVSDDGTVSIKAADVTVEGSLGVSTGASGVISMTSIATVTNGIVTAIS